MSSHTCRVPGSRSRRARMLAARVWPDVSVTVIVSPCRFLNGDRNGRSSVGGEHARFFSIIVGGPSAYCLHFMVRAQSRRKKPPGFCRAVLRFAIQIFYSPLPKRRDHHPARAGLGVVGRSGSGFGNRSGGRWLGLAGAGRCRGLGGHGPGSSPFRAPSIAAARRRVRLPERSLPRCWRNASAPAKRDPCAGDSAMTPRVRAAVPADRARAARRRNRPPRVRLPEPRSARVRPAIDPARPSSGPPRRRRPPRRPRRRGRRSPFGA